MAASPRRQQGMDAPGAPMHYQQQSGGMHPLSSVATGGAVSLQQQQAHSSPGTGLRSMVIQSDFRKVRISSSCFVDDIIIFF